MRGHRLSLLALLLVAVSLLAPIRLQAQYNIKLTAGGGPNGLPALSSSIGNPGGIARDANGNTYIADVYSNRVYQVNSAGTLTVFAGNGFGKGVEGGYLGDGGPAISAELNNPEGVAVDALGDVLIADTGNSVVRCVVVVANGCFGSTLAVGNITTVAGTGTQCQPIGSACGDGGSATAAQLNNPAGVSVDASGNLFIADTDDSKIRCVAAVTGGCSSGLAIGDITTVAGTGAAGYFGDDGAATSAQLNLPNGLFVDSSGDIFIADTYNSVIRCVVGTAGGCLHSTAVVGNITTVAGVYYNFQATNPPACNLSGDGGPATSAQLCLPGAVYYENGGGDLMIADTENSIVRCVVGTTGGCYGSALAIGSIVTVAGNGTLGYSGDGGLATSAQLNLPGGVVEDQGGDLFIADTGNSLIRDVVYLATLQINSFAGNHTVGYSGEGQPATEAALNAAGGVSVDSSGNMYIADTYNNVVREIAKATGDITTVAGNGMPCNTPYTSCGDGGAATSANLSGPQGVFVDSLGDIYIADTGDFAIRCVVKAAGGCLGSTLAVGSITTVAGTGTQRCTNTALPCGDGGPATSALLSDAFGVYVDNTGANNGPGNLFIADTSDSEIRCVVGVTGGCFGSTLAVGSITTVAGDGTVCVPAGSACGDGSAATSAQLNFPTGVYEDSFGNLFISDTFDSKVRCVVGATGGCYGSALTTGSITTVVGGTTGGYSGDGGPASSALLNAPYGIFVDSLDNLFIADSDNSALREVVAVTGYIQTLAGNGAAGYAGDPGPASNAQLATPLGVAGDTLGDIFVADTDNSRVRQLTSTVGVSMIPTSASLPTGGPQQFAATVTGANNTFVTWEVNGVIGGNATVGTIDPSLGIYTAPANIPSPATVTIRAIANANGFNLSTATVTVVNGATTPTVTISPTSTTSPAPPVTQVYTVAPQGFTATTTDPANAAVNWEVNGVAGGNATVGVIDMSGNYTAPASVPTPATVVITAVSQANANVSGSYPIVVVAAPTAPAPAAQTTTTGGSATFNMVLDGKAGYSHAAMTLSCVQSTLPQGATCTFKPPTIVGSTTGVNFALTVNLPACAALLTAPSQQRPYDSPAKPQFFASLLPLMALVLAGFSKGKKRRHLLLAFVLLCAPLTMLMIGCGGGSSGSSCPSLAGTYHIQVQGTIPGQPTPITITTVTLTVQ